MAPLWPLTFSSDERPRDLWALMFFNFARLHIDNRSTPNIIDISIRIVRTYDSTSILSPCMCPISNNCSCKRSDKDFEPSTGVNNLNDVFYWIIYKTLYFYVNHIWPRTLSYHTNIIAIYEYKIICILFLDLRSMKESHGHYFEQILQRFNDIDSQLSQRTKETLPPPGTCIN